MATLEEELRLDEEEVAREVEYIRQALPADLKEKFGEGALRYFIDAIADYFFESGMLDEGLDDDADIDIDVQKVAEGVFAKASADGIGDFDPGEVFFVVQADIDFQEQEIG